MANRNRLLWLVVAAQFMVPAFALLKVPTQYGFQMYSGLDWTAITIEDANGEPIEVPLNDYGIAHFRPDIDWTKRLPEHLCDHVPGAATVTVTRFRGSRCLTCD